MPDKYLIVRDGEKVLAGFEEYGPAVAKLAEYGKFLEDIGADVYVISNREIEVYVEASEAPHGRRKFVYKIKF